MTRATLLATTAALLLPITAYAQSVDADADVSTGTAGASANATAEGDTGTAAGTADEAMDTATAAADEAVDEVGETAEEIGDAATTTAQDTAEGTEQAVDDVAQGTAEAEATAETDLTAQAGVPTVGEIIGAEVVDASGESIGSVEMIVEQADGKAAVIGVGGFLGIGEHDVAIPASELSMDGEGRLTLSGYTEGDLRQRPEFNSTDAVALSSDVELPELG